MVSIFNCSLPPRPPSIRWLGLTRPPPRPLSRLLLDPMTQVDQIQHQGRGSKLWRRVWVAPKLMFDAQTSAPATVVCHIMWLALKNKDNGIKEPKRIIRLKKREVQRNPFPTHSWWSLVRPSSLLPASIPSDYARFFIEINRIDFIKPVWPDLSRILDFVPSLFLTALFRHQIPLDMNFNQFIFLFLF